MDIAAKIDDIGKPAWIALMILGFFAYWPFGLAILAYLVWSGRMRCWKRGGPGRWQNDGNWKSEGRERMRETMGRWCGTKRAYSSGNHAFDDYREETLRRLEEEEREFKEFLDRLRQAKDKAEFDQFMADRGRRPPQGPQSQSSGPLGPEPQPQA